MKKPQKEISMNCKQTCPAVRQVMFPADTNPSGNIFGGIILSHIDIAGAIAAKQLTIHRVVTVTMDKVIFKRPVNVGDILTCWTEILEKGRTSIKVKILVEAERQGEIIHVTEGVATYVSVDKNHRSIPWDSPEGTMAEDADKGDKPDASKTPAPAPAAPADADADSGKGCHDKGDKGFHKCHHGKSDKKGKKAGKKNKDKKKNKNKKKNKDKKKSKKK